MSKERGAGVMPKKEKKKGNTASLVIIFILALALTICIRHIITSNNRVEKLERYLDDYYYSQEHLQLAMQDTLGDIYGDDAEANFDNYVYKLVLDDINEHEPEEIAKYNTIFGKERTKAVTEQLDEYQPVTVTVDDGICTVKINDFVDGKTWKDIIEYKKVLEANRKFIIDLRGNSGGHTNELVEVLGLFYEDGTVVYTDIAEEITEKKCIGDRIIDFDSLVFLCDERTASSAEVMIFNMKSDFPDKVSVVGKQTYGKYYSFVFGDFSDGYSFAMVSSLMGNSKGETFDGNGIAPDIEAEGDECIERAMELLKGE